MSAGFGSGLRKTATVVAASAINSAVPKNGARQEMVPKLPPTSGPSAIPMPNAASYKMMAVVDPPLAAPTIPARAIVTNRAFPKPHPARRPRIWPIVSESPDRLAKTTIITSPVTRVALIPIRVEMNPAKNMVPAVTKRYEENSSIDSKAEADSSTAMVGKIGETKPIPTKDIAVAKVMAHTLAGCFKNRPAVALDTRDQLLSMVGNSYQVIGQGIEEFHRALDGGVVLRR